MQFSEHIKILIFALLIFSLVFVVAYTLQIVRLWIAALAVMIVLSGTIAVLARWSGASLEETE